MHTFSMTCKVDSVIDIFSKPEGRRQALRWFKDHRISKVYLESYRHRRLAEAGLLRTVRDEFVSAGIETAGCITTTQMSKRTATWEITTCFTDPSAHEFLQGVVEMTAGVFDLIILDDFFFSACSCPFCEKERNGRTWGDFRSDLMLDIARKRVIAPARAVNKNVKIIIKYPKWYEGYYGSGYDVLRETELFDCSWIGTETREPDSIEAGRTPQTAASWIQGWMNDASKGKCGGAWYDPIDTKPETFLEQARQSIIGGAKESLLHCYDYLATKTPGLAIHGKDLEIKNGLADAEAFKTEVEGLSLLAETLSGMEPYGVLLPKNPNDDPEKEAYLPSFAGMLGIPSVAAASLKDAPSIFLGAQARGFHELTHYIESTLTTGRPLLLTSNLLKSIRGHDGVGPALRTLLEREEEGASSPIISEVGENVVILRCPDDLWELTKLDQPELDQMRNKLLRPFGIEISAPAKVSLHLFKSAKSRCEVIENFNGSPVEVSIKFQDKASGLRNLELALPNAKCTTLARMSDGSYLLKIGPRSLALVMG